MFLGDLHLVFFLIILLLWSDLVICLCWSSINQIIGNVDNFFTQVVWNLVFDNHVFCFFNDYPISPFCYTICGVVAWMSYHLIPFLWHKLLKSLDKNLSPLSILHVMIYFLISFSTMSLKSLNFENIFPFAFKKYT